MTVDVTLCGLAFLWGAFLGLLYFGGLWLTLKTVLGRMRPLQWLAASAVVRLTVALAGFWMALRSGPAPLLCTLVGFFLVRVVLTRRLDRHSGGHHHAAHS